jgi:hypothetical protein
MRPLIFRFLCYEAMRILLVHFLLTFPLPRRSFNDPLPVATFSGRDDKIFPGTSLKITRDVTSR